MSEDTVAELDKKLAVVIVELENQKAEVRNLRGTNKQIVVGLVISILTTFANILISNAFGAGN